LVPRSDSASPYPLPTTPHASTIMRANPSRDTGPERRLRSELHTRGRRFRVNLPVRVDEGRPVNADIVFTRARIAVFVDGCFWHGCPEHGSAPRGNADYWSAKFRATQLRDRETRIRLEHAGWHVLRLWEHVPLMTAADLVEAAVDGER
jgi:DNA mismatch endonuclease (patch repair protein)